MSADRTVPVLGYLRNLAAGEAGRMPDRELVGEFIAGRDPGAFAALVSRHGPMIFHLCRRILRNEHDAEDVFQATFLVLARRADAVRRRESVGGWLYEVACRLAVKARAAAARRLARERHSSARESRDPLEEISVAEAQVILDQELARLPEKFRNPLVLCCLQGLARDEAARKLGWPASVVKSRLEQGRQRLRVRLARRGVALATVLGVTLLGGRATATVPAALFDSTVHAAGVVAAGGAAAAVVSAQAAALTNEVLNAMSLSKLKVLTVFALGVGLVASATGLLVDRTARAQPPATTPAASPPAAATEGEKKPAAATDQEKVQGTWEVVELVVKGEKVLPNDRAKGLVIFQGDGFRFVITAKGEADLTRTSATVKLDPAKSPRTIDTTATEEANKAESSLGIYELDGDDLTLCLANQRAAARPTAFKGEGEFVLFKLKRSKK
jgi:RNA polymerase sigma factor (sigma-70 family)